MEEYVTTSEQSTVESGRSEGGNVLDSPSEPTVSLRDVHKVYRLRSGKEARALNGPDFDAIAGSIRGTAGISGAGKSILVRCLTSLERPTSDHMSVADQDTTVLSLSQLREVRRHIGTAFQYVNLLDQRTTAQNIVYPLILADVPSGGHHPVVKRMFDLVGLVDRGGSYPPQLSGDQEQHVGITRALADDPAILLCGELTSALDPKTTCSILDPIKNVRDTLGLTVIIITHGVSVVHQVYDSVSLPEAGRIVESDHPENIVLDVDSRLPCEIVPFPKVPEAAVTHGESVIDVSIIVHPSQSAAVALMSMVVGLGRDTAAGVFRMIRQAWIGRLAVTIPVSDTEQAMSTLHKAGIAARVRS